MRRAGMRECTRPLRSCVRSPSTHVHVRLEHTIEILLQNSWCDGLGHPPQERTPDPSCSALL
eukprot:7485025-Lingulodinium_polyedra.AAC.1